MDSSNEAPLVRMTRDIPAAMEGLDDVHDIIAEYWNAVDARECCSLDTMNRMLFDSAVAEIAGNIVRHAYPEQADGETFSLTLQCFLDRVEAILIDHGVSFDFAPPSRLPDMRDALDNLDLDHGWGLPIVYAATDSLQYERLADGSNRWQMDKRVS